VKSMAILEPTGTAAFPVEPQAVCGVQ
jgi:hypothetical protein